MPNQSTLLQVLISIQGLILCEEPWYNEPGREASYRKGTDGPSKSYNQVLQQDTIRTAILGWTDQTPSIWKDVVDYHFQSNSNKILQSAEKWLQAKSLLASGGHGLGGFGMFPAEMPPGIPPMAHLGHSVRHKEEPGDLLARLQNAMKKYGATHVTKVLPKSTTKDQPATEPWKPAALPLHNAMSPSLSGWFPPQGSPSFSNPASSPFGLSSLGPVNVLGVGGNQPVMESTPNQAYPPTATPYGRGGYVLGGQPASRGGYTPMASPTYPPGLGPQDSSGQVRGGNGQGGRGTPSTRGRGGHRGRNPWL